MKFIEPRSWLPGLVALFLGVVPAVAQQAHPEPYAPVLQQIRAENPDSPLVLFTTVMKFECVRGGCDNPWADPLPSDWAESMKSAGSIVEFCAYDRGLCMATDGRSVIMRDGRFVMMSTPRVCGDRCLEIIAHQVAAVSSTSSEQIYVLYKLARKNGSWSVQSSTQVARGFLDS